MQDNVNGPIRQVNPFCRGDPLWSPAEGQTQVVVRDGTGAVPYRPLINLLRNDFKGKLSLKLTKTEKEHLCASCTSISTP